MSKIFNHTVQPLGSTTSPVEDLALEVEDAFSQVEDILNTSETVITNFGDTLGNPVFESLGGHSIEKPVSEVHNMLEDESDIVLRYIPKLNSLSMSYFDSVSNTTVQLTEIPFDQDFTDKNQYKISGKVAHLNIRVTKGYSAPVKVEYTTKTFSLGGKQFLSNVISNSDSTYEITPSDVGGNTYELHYDLKIKDNPEKHFQKTLQFFLKETGSEEYVKLNVISQEIKEDSVRFTTSTPLDNPSTSKIIAFAPNTSISSLLNALYKEFREHSHSREDMSLNIETKELVNRYTNTNKINYKDGDVTNYLFPQYFNREGYNPDLDSVYENSILGDLFLSRVISDTTQKFKGLDADSNALIFADPVRGHKVKYSRQDEALVLNSLAPVNGLRINTTDDDKYGLRLNDSELTSKVSGLYLDPQEGVFNVKSKDPAEPYTTNLDTLKADTAVLKDTTATSIHINDITLSKHSDGISALFSSKDNDKNVVFTTPIRATKITVDELVSPHEVKLESVNTDWAKFGDIHFKLNTDKNLVISDEGDPKNKKVIYSLPLETKARLTAHHITPDTINFGNIVFNTDDTDYGLNIWSTVPDQSFVNFKSRVKFLDGLEGSLVLGGITLKKDKDTDNAVIEAKDATHELLVTSKARFKNLHTDEDSNVQLNKVHIKSNIVGKVTEQLKNEQLHFVHTEDLTRDGKVTFEVPVHLDKMTYTELSGPAGSKATVDNLEVSTLTIGGVVISNNGSIVQPNPSPGTPAPTPTPGAVATPGVPGAVMEFSAKLKATNADVEELHVSKATLDAIKTGDIVTSKDDDNNVLIASSRAEAKIHNKVETTYDKLIAASLKATSSGIDSLTTEKVDLGTIQIEKDRTGDNVTISRTGVDGVLNIEAPIEAHDFTAVNFSTTNDARMKNIYGDTITVNGVTWTHDKDGHSTVDTKDTDKTYKFLLPVTFKEARADLLSSPQYKLIAEDKIMIDADNYITNHSGKFSANLAKGFTYVGSGTNTGSKYTLEHDSLPAMKQYISANSGAKAVDSEKNAFFEIDTNDGLYFLQPTNRKVQYKGSIWGFNDSTAQTNITDLRRWLRAPLYAGNVEFNKANLGLVGEADRNGLVIGETRISVIGPGTDCPSGLTTFESADSIHFVNPLAKDNTCRNLTYQEVMTGPISVKGDATVENSLTVADDFMVGGTSSVANLDVTELASISKMKVSNEFQVSSVANFKNEVDIENSVKISGNTAIKGNTDTKTLRVEQNAEVGNDLHVGKDLYVVEDVVIEGSLSLEKGFQTQGVAKSTSVETELLKAHSGEVLTNFRVGGTSNIAGKATFGAAMDITGNIIAGSNLEVKESVTANNLYTIKDVMVREKLGVYGNAELTGKLITLGSEETRTTINGKLSINTEDLSINSPTRIFSTLKVSEGAEFSSEVTAKAGISTESGITAKGVIRTESSAEIGASLNAKSGTFDQDLRVGSNLTTDSVTSKSLVVEDRAAVSNLTVSGSLTMPVDTAIVVGNIRASSYTQVDSNATNSFAGKLFVAKELEVANDLKINGTMFFDKGEFQISTLGIVGKQATVDVGIVRSETYTGTLSIRPPTELNLSGRADAAILHNLISSARNYMKIDNALFEGISVFSQPVVAGTIYYTDLISVKERADSGLTSSVDLVARRALYA